MHTLRKSEYLNYRFIHETMTGVTGALVMVASRKKKSSVCTDESNKKLQSQRTNHTTKQKHLRIIWGVGGGVFEKNKREKALSFKTLNIQGRWIERKYEHNYAEYHYKSFQ